MREILFRGKRTYNGEWFFVDDMRQYGDMIYLFGGADRGYSVACHHIIPETIGQYTGLRDKNCEGIFEGDIVRAEICEGSYQGFRFPVGEVVFEKGAFCIKDYKQTTPLSSYSPRVQFEVIGNIHDNPDLMKNEEAQR